MANSPIYSSQRIQCLYSLRHHLIIHLLQWSFTSLHPSACLFICPSICGWNHVRSVSSTILTGSILYLYILWCNFRRCFFMQNAEILFLANFRNLQLWLCLVLTWVWMNSMGNHGVVWVFSECRNSSCSSLVGIGIPIIYLKQSSDPLNSIFSVNRGSGGAFQKHLWALKSKSSYIFICE